MLDRSKSAPPMYLQIANKLSKDIEDKKFDIGDFLPSESQLCQQYDVSRMTARLALTELEKMGFVERRRGKGTKVVFGKYVEALKEITSFTDEMRQNGVEMTTSFCRIDKIKPEQNIKEFFNTENIYLLERVRNANNKPIVYSKTYLNVDNISEKSEDYENSLYEYLKKEKSIYIVKAEDQLEAIIANNILAEKLQIKVGSPIFMRTRKAYNQYKILTEYSISYYIGEKYKYTIIL